MISLERRLFCLWIFYKYMQRKIGQNRKEWYDYMKRLIYLDHAATTQPFPEVLDAMIPYYSRYYGNPSSGYELGEESSAPLRQPGNRLQTHWGWKMTLFILHREEQNPITGHCAMPCKMENEGDHTL